MISLLVLSVTPDHYDTRSEELVLILVNRVIVILKPKLVIIITSATKISLTLILDHCSYKIL